MKLPRLLFCVIIAGIVIKTVHHKLEMRHWTPIQAQVERSEVQQSWTRESTTSKRDGHYIYTTVVHYGFDANGAHYTGQASSTHQDHDSAAREAASFSSGHTVAVRYDPKNPHDSDMKWH